jgi:hypothetical protein
MQAEVASQPEVARPKTPTERAADFYYDLHVQREAKKKADARSVTQMRKPRESGRYDRHRFSFRKPQCSAKRVI